MVEQVHGDVGCRPINAVQKSLDDSNNSAKAATTWSTGITTVGTLLAVLLGLLIAFYTAKSIKEPIYHLIEVAQRIGETGDLEQTIDIHRDDEVGMLAENFNKMIVHLKDMAAVSAAIAEGQLSVTVQPRSQQDTMAKAFARMTRGLAGPGAASPRQRGAGGQRRGTDGQRFGRIGQSERAGGVCNRRSDQHDARDEHQRAERGEEHAGAGVERGGNFGFDRSDGDFDPARGGHGEAAGGYFAPLARGSPNRHGHNGQGHRGPEPHQPGDSIFRGDYRRAGPARGRHRQDHRGDRRSGGADQPACA